MSKLPILMYHSVSASDNESRGLTISAFNFEAQLKFLKSKGYQSFHFKDLQNLKKLPKKSVIITFDDVYVNQLELAVPLLKKYGFKASFYIPFQYVGGTNNWDEGEKQIMSLEQLQSLDSEVIELGMHSFAHGNYKSMSLEQSIEDFKKSEEFIQTSGLNIHRTLAYPYGKYPRKGEEKELFFNLMKDHNIDFGLRIGNRINRFPFKNNYEIQRIDIKGEDSLRKFKLKLKYGKLKLF
ncbi:polysaccharide deacetylase family protein [Winogradskyella jejuensis]|uniref:Polysaccharide deacetylase n=1 Tax=Winogradskyella jejuensis TaxID=1089305 RepID=A0A1M5JVK3_9FLAO|nr:polysaccharide deacetylase family protein [Winogradskyella jejuensis]SHG44320.1 Polysaccharide deacetylase [Winogradskyella jejuensis]